MSMISRLSRTVAAAALVSGLSLAAVVPAQAVVIVPGSGYSSVAPGPNSGVDAYGNPWEWNTTSGSDVNSAGLSAWGSPGLGAGTTNLYNGPFPATDFHISFVFLDPTDSINYTPSPYAGGYNEATRFDVCNPTCTEWTIAAGSTTNQVNFVAPTGAELHPGDSFFLNVIMDQGGLDGTNTGFSAFFTADTLVPEPASLILLGSALLGFGVIRRRRSSV